jgi:hypothetical protein
MHTKKCTARFKFFLGLLLLWLPGSIFAAQETVQIISFQWDETQEELQPLGWGNGTIIGQDLILTSKNITIPVNNIPADFLLICLSGLNSGEETSCDIPATVTAIHPELDAVLIRPREKTLFYPDIKYQQFKATPGENIRIEGFVLPFAETKSENINTKTLENILQWIKKGGDLKTGGDTLAVRRGNIEKIGAFGPNQSPQYTTDINVDFSISGGSAFDEMRNFIGISTADNNATNVSILPYYKIKRWVQQERSTTKEIPDPIMHYYKTKLRQPKIIQNRLRKIKEKLFTQRLTTNIFPINTETQTPQYTEKAPHSGNTIQKKSNLRFTSNRISRRMRTTKQRKERRNSYMRSRY